MSENRQLVLAHRPEPKQMVRDEDFELRVAPLPEPADGEIVVRVCWLGFDPAQRGWLEDKASYIPPVAIGEPMRATGIGQVVASRNDAFPVGALVTGTFGWQEHALADGGGAILPLRLVPEGIPPTAALAAVGSTGLTAYFGLLDVGRPSPGDVVLVSAAAGATGSVVGQLAKLHGMTAIGIAGGPEKCAWLTDTLGFDAAIDYKHDDVAARIRELAPDGIDLYFDNVGGAILDAALLNLAEGGTVVLCGAMSTRYATGDRPAAGVHNLPVLSWRNARMEGFIALRFKDRFSEGVEQLSQWIREGKLVSAEDVRHGGLEQAPATLRRLFEGRNLGKQLLQIAEPEVV